VLREQSATGPPPRRAALIGWSRVRGRHRDRAAATAGRRPVGAVLDSTPRYGQPVPGEHPPGLSGHGGTRRRCRRADCWRTRDGGLVCLHDTTVDRTTDGSGNTDELTVPGAEVLHVDAGSWFAVAWPNTLRVPTVTDVLDELGGQAVLCPEAKNAGAGRAIVDRLTQYGLLDAAIVQSFIRAELGPAVAAGGDAMMLTATSAYYPAALHASGIHYLGSSAALPPSRVSPATAAGLDVVTWVVNRRVDAAPWLAAGAIGFFSDDPLYLSGRSPVLPSDPFGQRTYYHGHLASPIAGDRGTFSAPHAWGYARHQPGLQRRGLALPIRPPVDVDMKPPDRVQGRVDVNLVMSEHRSITINAHRVAHLASSPRHPGRSTTALAPSSSRTGATRVPRPNDTTKADPEPRNASSNG